MNPKIRNIDLERISGSYRDTWPGREVETGERDAVRCLSNEALSHFTLFKNSDVIV